jgi:hypothetical protein
MQRKPGAHPGRHAQQYPAQNADMMEMLAVDGRLPEDAAGKPVLVQRRICDLDGDSNASGVTLLGETQEVGSRLELALADRKMQIAA